MKITVFGASGLTGQLVVEQAISRGFDVVAFVRHSAAFSKRPGLTVVEGALTNQAILESALRGAHAVVCCLGTRSKRFAKEVSLLQESLPLITSSMQKVGVDRFVLLSAFGIGDTARQAGWLARAIYRFAFRAIYLDKELSEVALKRSNLKWTILYPVGLNNGPLSDDVETRTLDRVSKVPGIPMVARANVARSILDAVKDDSTVHQRILVSSRGSVR